MKSLKEVSFGIISKIYRIIILQYILFIEIDLK